MWRACGDDRSKKAALTRALAWPEDSTMDALRDRWGVSYEAEAGQRAVMAMAAAMPPIEENWPMPPMDDMPPMGPMTPGMMPPGMTAFEPPEG